MANFWFDRRGTETYHSNPLKEGSTHQTDYSVQISHTKEEYEDQQRRFAEPASREKNFHEPRIWCVREKTNLQIVDEMLCDFMGDPKPDINRDSEVYWLVHELCFGTLYKCGGSVFGDKPEHWPYLEERIASVFRSLDDKSRPEDMAIWTEGRRARLRYMFKWALDEVWIFGASG